MSLATPRTGSEGAGIERSMAGMFSALRQPRPRRIAFLIAAIICAILSIWPRTYAARVKLLSQGGDAGGLSTTLGLIGGGLQNFAALIGGHQSAEVYLAMGRSNDVENNVIGRLHLIGRKKHEYPSFEKARLALARKVDIHTLNGGILEVEAKDQDPEFALELVKAYTAAIQDRVAQLSRAQTAKKNEIVSERFAETSSALARAQQSLDQFRRANKLADPQLQFGTAATLKVGLESQLQAKQLALQTAEQFAASESIQIKSLQSEIAALKEQIARDDANSNQSGLSNLAGLAEASTQYLNLYRTEKFYEALYEVYNRSLEQVTVQNLIAETSSDVQIIESPYVDPMRRYNVPGVAMLLAVLLLAFYVEYFLPTTRRGYGQRRVPRT